MNIDINDTIASSEKGIFSLYYRKVDNSGLFSSLEESELEIKNGRNYIPLYENYFNLNETNYNSINLNHRYYVTGLSGIIDKNNIQAAVVDCFNSTPDSLTISHKPVFIKFSPLIDPIKYMTGKYDISSVTNIGDKEGIEILNIPTFSKFEKKQGISKTNDRNNSAYVDGFFSYLSSQLLNHHDFINGLDFYGSFNAIKTSFHYNVIDDIDYLDKNNYFNKHKNILFSVEDIDDYSIDSDNNPSKKNISGARNMKSKIVIENNACENDGQYIIHDDFDSICNELRGVFNVSTEDTVSECNIVDINSIALPAPLPMNISISLDKDSKVGAGISESNNDVLSISNGDLNLNTNWVDSCDSDTDSCSSRSSYTDDDDASDGNGGIINRGDISRGRGGSGGSGSGSGSGSRSIDGLSDGGSGSDGGSDGGSDSDDDGDDDDDDDDDTLWATIKNFPVSAIMLEKCEDTLDSLMMQEDEMSDGEWKSALFQVIMTLAAYQKTFGFTHNDLHTNNVMFIHTEKEYIYYLYDKKYYRVPTYNRIFKIIDFGRAIYRYKSKIICSDSFSMTGDAATQYNCEPYLNDKKPRLDPNYSFDLCRLGCSIFDYFIDNIGDVAKICKANPIAKLIVEWVTDDQKRNILYKTNGEERYPDFKLYKMIARNVHNHTPNSQLSKPIFAAYEFPKKQVKPKHKIINIDKLPSYMV
jgi:hypothetical protein